MIVLKKLKHILFFTYLGICRIYRKILNKPTIYVFGDSHTINLQHELFRTTHVGPATAYNLISNSSITQAKKKIQSVLETLPCNQRHNLLFIFGEIDCRIHINKISRTKHKSLEWVVNSTVNRYIDFLRSIKKQFPKSIILVLNVLPAGEEKNIYNTKFYPSRDLHQKIVNLFNKKLNLECEKNSLIFISVFNELIDKEGKRIRKYVFDDIHFNKQIISFIIDKIFEKGGIL